MVRKVTDLRKVYSPAVAQRLKDPITSAYWSSPMDKVPAKLDLKVVGSYTNKEIRF
jgi:hypothetical protein